MGLSTLPPHPSFSFLPLRAFVCFKRKGIEKKRAKATNSDFDSSKYHLNFAYTGYMLNSTNDRRNEDVSALAASDTNIS